MPEEDNKRPGMFFAEELADDGSVIARAPSPERRAAVIKDLSGLGRALFLRTPLSGETAMAFAFASPHSARRVLEDAEAGRLDLSEVAEIERLALTEPSRSSGVKLSEDDGVSTETAGSDPAVARRLFLECGLSAVEAQDIAANHPAQAKLMLEGGLSKRQAAEQSLMEAMAGGAGAVSFSETSEAADVAAGTYDRLG